MYVSFLLLHIFLTCSMTQNMTSTCNLLTLCCMTALQVLIVSRPAGVSDDAGSIGKLGEAVYKFDT